MGIIIEDYQIDIKDGNIGDSYKNHDIVLLPLEGNRNSYYSDTINLMKYIKITHPEIKIELSKKEDVRYNDLRSDTINLGTIILFIGNITLSILINIISNYICDIHNERKNISCEIELRNENNGISKRVKYDGPSSGLDKIIELLNSKTKI